MNEILKPSLPTSWWGRRPPPTVTVKAAMGARTILQGRGVHQTVDILWDRKQNWTANGLGQPQEFDLWLRNQVMPWLRNRCGTRWIDPGGNVVYTLTEGQMTAEACAQNSFGYLYVGAWMR